MPGRQPGPWAIGPWARWAAMAGSGWYSLALSLGVGFGSCVEAAQLCPVIGRDCRVSTGDSVGEGSWQSLALLPVCCNQALGGREAMDRGMSSTGSECSPRT